MGNSIKCNYEVYCGSLTGRIRQTGIQRYSVPPKGVQGDLKGPKLKNRINYEERGMSAPTGTRGFLLSLGVLTINHLCQQKAFFQFSYQMKAREKVDGELTWFGHIPREQAKPGHAERRGDGTSRPKLELTKWSQCGPATLQHCKKGEIERWERSGGAKACKALWARVSNVILNVIQTMMFFSNSFLLL